MGSLDQDESYRYMQIFMCGEKNIFVIYFCLTSLSRYLFSYAFFSTDCYLLLNIERENVTRRNNVLLWPRMIIDDVIVPHREKKKNVVAQNMYRSEGTGRYSIWRVMTNDMLLISVHFRLWKIIDDDDLEEDVHHGKGQANNDNDEEEDEEDELETILINDNVVQGSTMLRLKAWLSRLR